METVQLHAPQGGSHRTGSINGLTAAQIGEKLGIPPGPGGDKHKVVHEWWFSAGGKVCNIWDYKGSHEWEQFSTYGDPEALRAIFGDAYTHEG